MEIKLVSYDEFDTLMDVMNTSFGFKDDISKFEHILPKLYYKDNPNMVHVGLYDNGKLVSSIGIYLMELLCNEKSLNIGCVGAVSTLPSYRNKGYFQKVITRLLQEAKRLNLDMLFLGGDRLRYGRYGFENAGRNFEFSITRRTRCLLDKCEYKLLKVNKNDKEILQDILNLYNEKVIYRIKRNIDNIYDVVTSWNATLYAVMVNEKLVAYFAIEEERLVSEFAYKDGYKDHMFNAMLDVNDNIFIQAPMNMADEDTIKKAAWYQSVHNNMFNILNYKKVASFMEIEDINVLDGLEDKQKIRKILGDAINNNISNKSLFIFHSDAG